MNYGAVGQSCLVEQHVVAGRPDKLLQVVNSFLCKDSRIRFKGLLACSVKGKGGELLPELLDRQQCFFQSEEPFLKIIEPLCPPNPKPLLSAYSIERFFGVFGVTSRSTCGSRLSRLMVGGTV